MPVRAPYAFVPLSDEVFFPPWADLVSHDVPFKDGWCGEIEIEIRTLTPLVVGAEREGRDDGSGEVRPYRLPDGRYAIPPSSLQGMLRNVLEIATFGRMAAPDGELVEERRFGIRDPNSGVEELYRKRVLDGRGRNPINVTYHVKQGWLRRDEKGDWFLTPCNSARVSFAELSRHGKIPIEALQARGDARARYDLWTSQEPLEQRMFVDVADRQWDHGGNGRPRLSIPYRKASFSQGAGRPPKDGLLVFTGKMNANVGAGAKKQEWFFYDNQTAVELPISEDVRRDFLAIHQSKDGSDPNPNWAYWREAFEAGRRVPIFWLWDDPRARKKVEALGTALLMKLPHKFSTHEMLSDAHKSPQLDFATAIFGAKAGKDAGLRRRTSFGEAIFKDVRQADRELAPRILMGPKPSYYPCYVRQPSRPDNRLDGHEGERGWVVDEPYATYTPVSTAAAHAEARAPQLAGWKRFPAANGHAQPFIPEDLADKPKLQTRLSTLPAKSAAIATMHFHNMRGNELGGLVWALAWGGETTDRGAPLRHRLGMGKAFGLGQVEIRITRVDAVPNDPGAGRIEGEAEACAKLVQVWADAFVGEMDVFVGKGEGGWRNTEQIGALLAMADPNFGDEQELWYMSVDEHMKARNEGRLLPSYPKSAVTRRRG